MKLYNHGEGPSRGRKRLLPLSHLRHYASPSRGLLRDSETDGALHNTALIILSYQLGSITPHTHRAGPRLACGRLKLKFILSNVMLSCLAPVAVLCSADPVLTDSSYRGSLGKENLLGTVYLTRYLTCRYLS